MDQKHEQLARTSAAFLLVIPGLTLAGVGIGMVVGNVPGMTALGLGLGMAVWGFIVALRRPVSSVKTEV
jgi:hypothetical protein